MSELRSAAEAVVEAIMNPGPVPGHHVETMRRHRQEWPRLWGRLDDLRFALDRTPPDSHPNEAEP